MQPSFNKVGIYHHPVHAEAQELAARLHDRLQNEVQQAWVSSAWDPVNSTRDLPDTDLLICVGGDGTVLRAARAVIPHETLILGVDMGRQAFLTEFTPPQLDEHLSDVLHGKFEVEERTMLHADVHKPAGEVPQHIHALNDVIVGRDVLGRPSYINVKVDGDLIGVLRADAVVVATATGSTGYSLSAGGPILHPLARSVVLTPVAPHLSAAAPLVLPADSVIDLSLGEETEGSFSIDGQGPYPLKPSGGLRVKRSGNVARMLRFWGTPFFAQMGRHLAWLDERRLRVVARASGTSTTSADNEP